MAAHGCDPKSGYSAEEIDFLVAHVPPEEAWYVIPVEAFAPHLHLWLYPRGEHAGQYEKYREAWELLKDRIDLQGCAEEGEEAEVKPSGWMGAEMVVIE